MTDQVPGQPPEGKLIEDARKAGGHSIRHAAAVAGISEARWRQLVKGSMAVAGGSIVEQVAPVQTLAKMAMAVGISPEQLSAAGRDDAADVLKNAQPATVAHAGTAEAVSEAFGAAVVTGPSRSADDEIELIYRSRSMTARQKLDAIRMVLQLRLEAEGEDRPASRPADTKPPARRR